MPQQVPSIKLTITQLMQQQQQPQQQKDTLNSKSNLTQQNLVEGCNGDKEPDEAQAIIQASGDCLRDNSINKTQCQPATSGTDTNAQQATDDKQTTDSDNIVPIDTDPIDDLANNNNDHALLNATDESKPQQQTGAKLNGLKNRIIQRPPPLVLDKVSNFFYNGSINNGEQQSPQQRHNQNNQLRHHSTNLTVTNDEDTNYIDTGSQHNHFQQANRSISNPDWQTNQTIDATILDRTSSNSNANHKFWASLSENASRNKALANARTICSSTLTAATTTDAVASSTLPLTHSKDSNDSLGLDLIIKHRNSNSTNQLTGGVDSGRRHFNQHHRFHSRPKSNNSHDNQNTVGQRHNRRQHRLGKASDQDHLDHSNQIYQGESNAVNELDDSGGATSETGGGGNIIGVDNSSPPAVDLQHQNRMVEERLASTSSGRPRSNNPFLDDDDNFANQKIDNIHANNRSSGVDSDLPLQNNFHKRPASFIAATADKLAGIRSSFDNQETIEEKSNEIHLHDSHRGSSAIHRIATDYQGSQKIYHANQDSINHPWLDKPVQQINFYQQIYGSINYDESREPGISVYSESAVCQPPPSATMQLPHWSEAIYELNNAILETSSVSGGAENGQFIYIAESGDIILELDRIKVSGFTLLEFNELVELKQFHLLSAVQTKHSHGLTNDLGSYLNQSFAKDSKDKELQNVIRDNVYRRTIPCTTRPPRQGEVDKVDYHFLSKEQFININNQNKLLECGIYGEHYYGTLKPLCDLNDLSVHSSSHQKDASDSMRQPWDANHPAVGLMMRKNSELPSTQNVESYPLYENHESLMQHQQHFGDIYSKSLHQQSVGQLQTQPAEANVSSLNIVAVDSEALPSGWERVVDQTHGTYYIDHNTKRTQYERPYEVELTKGSMGFGFTLVEADNGLLLVRSVIHGGPAHMNGLIRPGDILVSAVGVSVTGLQHTDIARLFSTFAVGDRVRLTFARSNYVLDKSLVPDEYLFSNGTDGNLALAFNPNNLAQFKQNMATINQSPHILVDQEFEFTNITLKRGDQGFGFTINDSVAGQKVGKIQNREVCSDLKQGDILTSLDGQDITQLTHKEVVERLKKYTPGQDVNLIVKRKKRFRSKTPMAMHTNANGDYSHDSTPQRNCKTPSLDGLMLKRSSEHNPADLLVSRHLMQQPLASSHHNISNYSVYSKNITHLPPQATCGNQLVIDEQHIYGSLPRQYAALVEPQPVYYNQQSLPTNVNSFDLNNGLLSRPIIHPLSNTTQATESSLIETNACGQSKIDSELNKIHHQYNDYIHNDKPFMIPIHPQQDFNHMPLQNEVLQQRALQAKGLLPTLPIKPPTNSYTDTHASLNHFHSNFYANNEEIALQNSLQSGLGSRMGSQVDNPMMPASNGQFNFIQGAQTPHDEHDEHEYHHVELVRENTDSNWGIRLIGGAEVDRAISIGSMISGGVAYKSGKLKSGDEIISIDGVNVVGATHQDVVKLISGCTVRVSLVVRRKAFAEACDVVLTKNMDEGFGFVIISSENCALIGKIIEGSPADRCKQLRVRDCIIAVNGRFITPDMKHPEIVNMIKECGSTLRLRIIPVDCYTVKLIKDAQNESFGFRMRGGSEYDGTPLYIVRVEMNGQAHGLLNVGDQILEINNIPTVGMTHQQAATIIKYSDPIVKLKLRRNFETPPSLLVDSPRALQKYNQVTAEMKTVSQTITPNPISSSVDGSQSERFSNNYASLPVDVNTINHQPQHMMQQSSNSINVMEHLGQHPQHVYERRSLDYSGPSTLYAT